MNPCSGRRWRAPLLLSFAALWFAPLVQASDAPPATAMSLAEAQRLAIDHQPLLDAGAAQVASARDRAIAARQLPDPQLKLAVLNVPVDSADAWRFNRDSMTQSMVGVSQQIPLPGKRRLSSEVMALSADEAQAEFEALKRAIERDAGLAYLDWLHPHHAAALLQMQIQQAQQALEVARFGYRSGRRSQADVLEAQAGIGLLEDRAAQYQQMVAVAGENLRRWTGEMSVATPQEPTDLEVPPVAALVAYLEHHPEWIAAQRSVDRAMAEQRLALKSRQPDLNVEVDYGYRSDYSDMVSLQVGIPLPLFTRNRQDRDIAAAQAQLDAVQAGRDDLQRRLVAEVSADYQDWQSYGGRIERYGQTVIPPLSQRAEASLAEYRAGSGSLGAVIGSRQALLDAQVALLDLRLQRLRAALKLRYFAPER